MFEVIDKKIVNNFITQLSFIWRSVISLILAANSLTLYILVSSINFANSLDPDQARQNVGPDLDPNCLTLRWYS